VNYVYLANGWVGYEVLRWLMGRGQPPVGLVLHPADRGKYRTEMIRISGLSSDRIFDGTSLHTAEVRAGIEALQPYLGLSVLFDYILKKELLALFPRGCLNLHPALLPYNRGQYPNVWSLVEGTPSGVTLHYTDEGIDTGDIVAQKEVAVGPTDTGETLYRKLERVSVELFKEVWPQVCSDQVSRTPQVREAGTYHRTRDVETIDEIVLNRTYLARDLINILRARTFPPYRGAYFVHNGRRIYLQVLLRDEADT
jgi:methionyl-tRNA formyltransferase